MPTVACGRQVLRKCRVTAHHIFYQQREREGEKGERQTEREGGRERERWKGGVGSWPYRIQCKKFDFHRLFKGIYAIGSVETPGPMGFHNLSNL